MGADEKHNNIPPGDPSYVGLKSLAKELFQSDLIAPTDVDSSDIQFSRRVTVYHQMLVLMVFAVGVIGLESAFLRSVTNPLSVFALMIELLLLVTLVRLMQSDRMFLPPVVTLSLVIGLVLWSVSQGLNHQVLWLFPLMIAMAGLLPPSIALLGGTVTLGILFYSRGLALDADQLAQDAALVATWLISLAVMRLMTRQSDELADLALTDHLTGAYNRRYLLPQAERHLATYTRYSRLSAMLMVDIDHFKSINDELGHPEGDRVLREMVALIDKRVRGVDMIFRLGGEEFLILLSEVGSQTAVNIAEELRQSIETLDLLPDRKVTVSIGICDVTQVETAEQWLQKADEAMYHAKQTGRNRVSAIQSAEGQNTFTSSLPVWR